jgi:hypothetical protein
MSEFMREKTPPETRKPYRTPVLSVYGDVRQITQTTNGPKNDNPGRAGKTM